MKKKKQVKKKNTKVNKKNKKSCRKPSDKCKDSKVQKLIALAKKNPQPKKKRGGFLGLFKR